FDQADPGHPETALLNGDAAGFAQQFAAFAYAHDGGVDAAEHRLNAAQARNPFLLQPPIRNVPSHAAVTLDGAFGVEQRQRIAVQPANAAVGVLQVQHHVAPAALLRDAPPQKSAHRRPYARRHDVETALAHELIRRIAQDGFRRRAAEGVPAFRVDFPDPLLGGFRNGAKSFLAGSQRPFRLDAVRDVLDLIDEIMRLARLQPDQGAAQLGPNDLSVLADIAFIGLIGLDGSRQHLAHLSGVGIPVVRI